MNVWIFFHISYNFSANVLQLTWHLSGLKSHRHLERINELPCPSSCCWNICWQLSLLNYNSNFKKLSFWRPHVETWIVPTSSATIWYVRSTLIPSPIRPVRPIPGNLSHIRSVISSLLIPSPVRSSPVSPIPAQQSTVSLITPSPVRPSPV